MYIYVYCNISSAGWYFNLLLTIFLNTLRLIIKTDENIFKYEQGYNKICNTEILKYLDDI